MHPRIARAGPNEYARAVNYSSRSSSEELLLLFCWVIHELPGACIEEELFLVLEFDLVYQVAFDVLELDVSDLPSRVHLDRGILDLLGIDLGRSLEFIGVVFRWRNLDTGVEGALPFRRWRSSLWLLYLRAGLGYRPAP